MEKRFESPTVNLQTYSGTKLNIINQIRVKVSRDGFSVSDVVVQVQEGAPTALLLGTDILPQLGFAFLQRGTKQGDVDLLTPQPVSPQDSTTSQKLEQNQPELVKPMGMVRLIQATRLPARHLKLVRARVDGCGDLPVTLFEPDTDMLMKKD